MTRALVEKLTLNDRTVGIEWKDGHKSTFPLIWLRDHCKSEASQHPSSGHRLFETASLDASLEAKSVSESSGMLVIEWKESGHLSQLPLAWLRDHCMSQVERDRRAPKPILWEGSAAQSRVHDYGTMVSSADALYQFMADIRDFGFARVTSVPVEHHAVTKVVELFGYVRETNYGRVFDVESTVDAVHLAYTPVALSMHTDNVYRNPMPGLQFLHCLETSVGGGEAILVDGFKIAETLRDEDPEAFDIMTKVPVAFRYTEEGADLRNAETLIDVDQEGRLTRVKLNNRSAAPAEVDAAKVEAFYRAYQAFARTAERDAFKYVFPMKPGDLWAINNQRVMHGRTSFDPGVGGRRHMQGCYADRDSLDSKIRVLAKELDLNLLDAARPGSPELTR